MQRTQRSFIQRLRPFSLFGAGLLITQPLWFKLYIAYQLTPATWFLYAGSLVLGLGVLAATYWHDARIARDPGLVDVPYLIILGVVVAAGLAIMTWYQPIYTHARVALQRSAMERAIAGGAACPAATHCVRDVGGQIFFQWGAHDDQRNGICYDPSGELPALMRTTRAALAASQPLARQRFGAAIAYAKPLGGPYYRCSMRVLAG